MMLKFFFNIPLIFWLLITMKWAFFMLILSMILLIQNRFIIIFFLGIVFFTIILIIIQEHYLTGLSPDWFFLEKSSLFSSAFLHRIDVINSVTIRADIVGNRCWLKMSFGLDPFLNHLYDWLEVLERLPCVKLVREIFPFYEVMGFV